jgi:hypothetical protein
MRTKIFVYVSLLIFAAFALVACSTPAVQAQGTDNTLPRTLSINGHGEVMITPDLAYIFLGVRTENPNASTAVEVNTRAAQSIVDALIASGIAPEDLQTTNFNLYSMDNYDVQGRPTDKVYVVENTVFVTVRDLAQMGDMLATAINAGANNIQGIQFDVADKEAALAQARELAVQNARTQAEDLARLTGVQLGDVQSVNMYGSGFPTPFYGGMGGGGYAMDQAASVPISPGQMVISIDVGIVYEIQ